MATYEVSVDGKTYQIDAPDDVPQEQVLAHFQNQYKSGAITDEPETQGEVDEGDFDDGFGSKNTAPNEPYRGAGPKQPEKEIPGGIRYPEGWGHWTVGGEKIIPASEQKSTGEALARGATQGATFGFGDEFGAGPNALYQGGKRMFKKALDGDFSPSEDWDYVKDMYSRIRDAERDSNDRSAEQHPVAYHGAEIGASLPLFAAGGPEATLGKTITTKFPKLASYLDLGLRGATSGFGHGEGDLKDQAGQAATSGVMTMAGKGLFDAFGATGRYFTDKARNALVQLGDKINKARDATAGDLNNPEVLTKVKSVFDSINTAEVKAALREASKARKAALAEGDDASVKILDDFIKETQETLSAKTNFETAAASGKPIPNPIGNPEKLTGAAESAKDQFGYVLGQSGIGALIGAGVAGENNRWTGAGIGAATPIILREGGAKFGSKLAEAARGDIPYGVKLPDIKSTQGKFGDLSEFLGGILTQKSTEGMNLAPAASNIVGSPEYNQAKKNVVGRVAETGRVPEEEMTDEERINQSTALQTDPQARAAADPNNPLNKRR